MNPSPAPESPPEAANHGAEPQWDRKQPENWQDAMLALFSSRIALMRLEAKDAAKGATRRIASLVIMILCAFFTWALLLAGGIAGIAAASGWPWYGLALAAAAVHLIVAAILAGIAKAPANPAFPVTRAEFEKDREWIEKLKKTRK